MERDVLRTEVQRLSGTVLPPSLPHSLISRDSSSLETMIEDVLIRGFLSSCLPIPLPESRGAPPSTLHEIRRAYSRVKQVLKPPC